MGMGDARLSRSLGVVDSVVVGLAAMVGAGIFAALGPASAAAGDWLLVALAIAAVVAYCNARSSARLAAVHPESGGTYVYGRERLGPFWGYLAGWGFVVGKTASCAAMAMTVGAYAWPGNATAIAVLTVLVVTAVNYAGVQKSARAARLMVTFVLLVLLGVVVIALAGAGGPAWPWTGAESGGLGGILQAAGLLFFAFAGYARIATLGEEVRDPARTIPRAIGWALAITLGVYLLVAVAVISALGPEGVAGAIDPLAQAVGSVPGAEAVVRAGAVVAVAGALLSLLLGVSRTVLAMARDGHLPSALAAVHPRFGVPHRAELAVGIAVVVLVLLLDVRGAIGFSAFAVLFYYLVANASAWTLDRSARARVIPLLGAVGCVVLGLALPLASVVAGLVVQALGAAVYVVRRQIGAS
ncbi:APC family permease [Lolliginicoccus suaedae]|uniref:APC family permease n=1 Tax=Lolliginicoccus suaedae TaxID=2605429 RepID=UPI0011EFA4F7|nr:amino acid permease [Lolliginicoccus suaedae]